MDPDRLALLPLWYIAFLLSTTCHEAAHALLAKLGGDLTAFHGGQVSLNPLPHIRREPFGTVIMPLLSFIMGGAMIGWASAPYDPFWRQRYPKRAAWMSLAGPAANFTIAILAGIAMRVGLAAGLFTFPTQSFTGHLVGNANSGALDAIGLILSILFFLNVLLGVFNLVPIPPLDGFSALGVVLPERVAFHLGEWEQRIRGFAYLGLLLAWQVFPPLFRPVYRTALSLFGL